MKLVPEASVSTPRRWVATILIVGLSSYWALSALLSQVSQSPPIVSLLTFTQGWTPVPPITAPENFRFVEQGKAGAVLAPVQPLV